MEQMGHSSSSSKCPCCSCRVKHAIVGTAKVGSDADARFVACDGSDQNRLTRGPNILRGSQNSGKHDRCRMKDRPIMHIVLLNDMGRRPIHEGRKQRGSAATRDQDLACPLPWPHVSRQALQNLDRARVAPSQGRSDPIEEELLRALNNGPRELLKAEVRQKGREGSGGFRL